MRISVLFCPLYFLGLIYSLDVLNFTQCPLVFRLWHHITEMPCVTGYSPFQCDAWRDCEKNTQLHVKRTVIRLYCTLIINAWVKHMPCSRKVCYLFSNHLWENKTPIFFTIARNNEKNGIGVSRRLGAFYLVPKGSWNWQIYILVVN